MCALGAWVRGHAASPSAWAAPNPLHHWHPAATQSDPGVKGKYLTQDLGKSINSLIWKTSLIWAEEKKELEENKRKRLVFPNMKMSLFLCLCRCMATNRWGDCVQSCLYVGVYAHANPAAPQSGEACTSTWRPERKCWDTSLVFQSPNLHTALAYLNPAWMLHMNMKQGTRAERGQEQACDSHLAGGVPLDLTSRHKATFCVSLARH